MSPGFSRPLFCLLAACLLAACNVTSSKHPVGERVPKLDAEEWNGRWVNALGWKFESQIKDARLGIVTISHFPDLNQLRKDDRPGQALPPFDITVRCLEGDVVGSATAKAVATKMDEPSDYLFGRIEVANGSLLIFPPDGALFKALVHEKRLAGSEARSADGKVSGDVVIDSLTNASFQKSVSATKYEGRAAFVKKPVLVFVRTDYQKHK